MLFNLKSVGNYLDTKTGLTYRYKENGTIDTNTPIHISEIETQEWWDELSPEDLIVAKRTLFAANGEEYQDISSFINKIDWELLTRQKQTLLDITQRNLVIGSHIQDLDGLINFLDAFQDAAVLAGVPEVDVFPNVLT